MRRPTLKKNRFNRTRLEWQIGRVFFLTAWDCGSVRCRCNSSHHASSGDLSIKHVAPSGDSERQLVGGSRDAGRPIRDERRWYSCRSSYNIEKTNKRCSNRLTIAHHLTEALDASLARDRLPFNLTHWHNSPFANGYKNAHKLWH